MEYEEYLRYEPLLARRVAAAVLDHILLIVIYVVYIYVVGEETSEGTYTAQGPHHFFTMMLMWFLYFPVMEGVCGYTLFKGLFDLKVVPERRNDGRFGVALKRHLLDPVDFAFFGLVAILLVKTRDDHKRLGGLVAYSHIELDRKDAKTGVDEMSRDEQNEGVVNAAADQGEDLLGE